MRNIFIIYNSYVVKLYGFSEIDDESYKMFDFQQTVKKRG